MKYLKYFETEAEYTAYKNGSDYVLPNRRCCSCNV